MYRECLSAREADERARERGPIAITAPRNDYIIELNDERRKAVRTNDDDIEIIVVIA